MNRPTQRPRRLRNNRVIRLIMSGIRAAEANTWQPTFGLAGLEGLGWRRLLEAYLGERESLVGLVLTVDIRRGLTPLDEALLQWIAPRKLAVMILLTKADKLSRGAGLARQHQVAGAVAPEVLLTRFSAISRDGVDEARAWLEAWLVGTD